MTPPRWRRSRRPSHRPAFRPHLETLEGRVVPTTYVVTNPADAGDGTLRQAIMNANANPGPDTITFSIGSGVRSIALASPLPAITDPVVLDATTQPGYSGSPLIELNGAAAGSGAIGLNLAVGNCTVKGFVINRFASRGILLQTGGGSLIQGDYVGTDVTGTVALPNGAGIDVFMSNNNLIGGGSPASRNLISGNRAEGVAVYGGSTNNLIEGNYIGTDAAGAAALGNATGVILSGQAAHNTIGGDFPAAGNVISGNGSGVTGDGVSIFEGATANVVRSNLIGTDANGARAVGNAGSGVSISSPGNLVGGTGSGLNVLSGNGNYGVALLAGATGNGVQGNRIGTDVFGAAALPNRYAGVGVTDGASNNTVGGFVPGSGNIISGNTAYGVVLFRPGTTANQVVGNLIGTNAAGTAALPNVGYGVGLTDGAAGNTVGGALPTPGNLISGNTVGGVVLFNPGTSRNLVQGNRIGTDVTGTVALPNQRGIVVLQGAAYNTLGGTADGAGNLVSGNTADGIQVSGIGSDGTVIQGNRVGTDAAGANPLPNGTNGITLLQNADSTTVGGTAPGSGNLISGNTGTGIFIAQDSLLNLVLGNRVGTDAAGTSAVPNLSGGVTVSSATFNRIGGTAPGSGNLISGNASYGIFLNAAANTVIQGNTVGADASGSNALPNERGVILTDSDNVLLGGSDPGAGNVVSGNSADGILITSGQNDVIQGNQIGTDPTGAFALGNGGNGIWVSSANSSHILIGGLDPAAANRIGYNGNDGVLIDFATAVSVLGNSILGNGNLGIELADAGNHDQEAPELTSVTSDGSTVTITGTLTSAPDTDFTLEFFSNSVCNPSGFGEGETLLGRVTVTTGDDGTATFTVTFDTAVGTDQFLSATATDSGGNTSAFSACVPVTSTGPGAVPIAPRTTTPAAHSAEPPAVDRFFAGLERSQAAQDFRDLGWYSHRGHEESLPDVPVVIAP